MYALAPELDCVADVMQNVNFPSVTASRISCTLTSRSVNPSDSARLFFMPRTTGVTEIDSVCLTTCFLSPILSHRLFAGHTASYEDESVSRMCMMSRDPL